MNGILTTGLAMLAGVCLYAAVQHAWIGWRQPPLRVHVLFAWLCLLVSLYVLAKLGAYRADSVPALVGWRRAELSIVAVFFAVLPWFAATYTGVWRRAVLYGLIAFSVLIFAANLILPYGVLFVEAPPLRYLTLPWGETVTDLRAHQHGAWFLAGLTNLLLSFSYTGYACACQYRCGERRQAGSLAVALGVFLVFVLFNQAVNYGLVEFTLTAEFGFIALILLMSRALSRELRASGEALRDSEARFRSLVEQSPFSIQVLAPDGRTRLVNRAWETLWGLKLPALANYNILHDRQLVAKGIAPYLQRGFAGEPVEIPPVVYNPQDTPEVADGPHRDRWVRAYVYPIQDEARRVREVILMHEDVTERKRTEDALQSSEARLRATLDNTPGVAVQWFDRAGRVLYWNRASETLYGIPAAQAVGKTLLELLYTPEQFREFLGLIAMTERQGQAYGPTEVDIHSVSGAEVTVLYTLFAVPGAGTEPIFVCMDVNITERRQAEQALRASEERLRTILQAEPECVKILAADGTLLDMNPAGLAMIEADSMDQVQGQKVANIVASEHRAAFVELCRRVVRNGESRQLQFEIIGLRGGRRWLETNAVPLRDAATGENKLLGVTRDITASKHAEAERERLLAELSTRNIEMENFVYTISHDLKAPLITIGGFASLLVKDIERGDKERGRESIMEIQKAAEGMQQLIEDLLLLSRTGQVQGEPEDVDLHAILGDVQARCASHIERERATIRVVSPLPRLHVDRLRFGQVLQNLLDNGVKFHRKGVDPVLEIGAERNAGELRLYVRDNGIGIEKRYQEKIFGLFERLDTKREGTGVGLTIARRVVEQYGGRLWVESEPGRGSTFWISFPDSVIVDDGAGESARDIRTLR